MPIGHLGFDLENTTNAQMPLLNLAKFRLSKFRPNAQMPIGHLGFDPGGHPKCPNAPTEVPPRPKFFEESDGATRFLIGYRVLGVKTGLIRVSYNIFRSGEKKIF